MSIRSRARTLLISATAFGGLFVAVSPAASAAYTPTTGISASSTQAMDSPQTFTTVYDQPVNRTACAATCASKALLTENRPKKIVQTTPPGMLFDPQAVPTCTPSSTVVGTVDTTNLLQWSCAAAAQVGTETINGFLCGSIATSPCSATTLTGKIYNVPRGTADGAGNAVGGAAQAQRAAIIDPASSTTPNDNFGIGLALINGDQVVATLDNLPTTSVAPTSSVSGLGCTAITSTHSRCDLFITRIQFDITGNTGTGSGHPVVTLPSYCTAGTMTQVATSQASEEVTGTASFTATGCDSVAFSPTLALTLSTSKRGAHPAMNGVVTQAATEQAVKSATISFPKGFQFNSSSTTPLCPTAQQGTGQTPPGCATNTAVGNTAISARQWPTSLFGSVFAGQSSTSARVNLVASAGGYAGLVLRGSTGSNATSNLFDAAFEGLPATTFTNFTLKLLGGKPGLLTSPKFCKTYTVTGSFTSQAGKTATSTADVPIRGCKKPTALLTKRLRRGSHPALSMGVGSAGTVLNKVSFTISGVRFGRGGASKVAAGSAGILTLSIFGSNKKVKLTRSKSKGGLTLKGKLDKKAISASIKRAGGGSRVTFKGLPTTLAADNYLTGVTLKLSRGLVTVKRNCRRVTFTANVTDTFGPKATNPYAPKKPPKAHRRCR